MTMELSFFPVLNQELRTKAYNEIAQLSKLEISFPLEKSMWNTLIKIPHYRQPTDRHCVPTCQKMVLEYARKQLKVNCPILSIKKIAKTTGINREGVVPKDAEKINDLLRRSKPPIKFQTVDMANFDEITEELKEERPVIVFINVLDLPDILWHAVVVVDFVPNGIIYHDPDENEDNCIKKLEIGVFMGKWSWRARLIKLLIEKRQQTYIPDYPKNQIPRENE
jgi:hypothetical protein